jgi:hypothetical protein
VSVNDVDGNLSTTRLTVTNGALTVSLPAGRHQRGRQRLLDADLVGHPGADQRRAAPRQYQGNANFNGADTLTVLSTDATARPTRRGGHHRHSVNDAPVNTVPGAQTVNEDTSLSIGGISSTTSTATLPPRS